MSVAVTSGVSTLSDTAEATRQALGDAIDTASGEIDLLLLFHSTNHVPAIRDSLEFISQSLPEALVVGCTTQAVIGGGQEIESAPGLSVWGLSTPAEMESFHVDISNTPDGPALVGFPLLSSDTSAVVMMGDPFTFPAPHLLNLLNQDHPGLPVIGGLASGGTEPGAHALIEKGRVHRSGAVGAIFGPGMNVQALVAQGCKPIGDPFVITDCDRNLIVELGGRSPLRRVNEIAGGLSAADRSLLPGGLMVGLLIDEQTQKPRVGDFLIRGIVRVNMDSGEMSIGEIVQTGQTVQFHLRDPDSASAELDQILLRMTSPSPPAGALMFTCNGRGTQLFGSPNHDVQALENRLGELPAAGMFCAGEFGPVGGMNFLHGVSTTVALFS